MLYVQLPVFIFILHASVRPVIQLCTPYCSNMARAKISEVTCDKKWWLSLDSPVSNKSQPRQ